MPLESIDIVFYYTGQATGPANNTLSLGGTISAYTISSGLANNVFDDVTGDESSTGDTEFRAIAVRDTNTVYDMLNTYVWIQGYEKAVSGADTIYFALENPGGTPASIQVIDDEEDSTNKLDPNKFTVKTGATVSWTEEGTPSSSLFFGTVNAGEWFGLWLRRIVPKDASAKTNRSVTIQVQCETTESPFRKIVTKTYIAEWQSKDFRFYEVTPCLGD